jgi:hypothetical protein
MSGYDPAQCKAERERAESKIMAKLTAIEKRLYVDNGNLSIQTRIDRLSVAHLSNQWLARVAISAVILHVVATLVERMAL